MGEPETIEGLRAELAEARKDAALWKGHWQMYRDAWVRELGGWLVPKSHEIDALVLTTRKRCVNPLLGNCNTPHWLGKPTEDRKALTQTPHPRENSCKEWKFAESTSSAIPGECLICGEVEGNYRHSTETANPHYYHKFRPPQPKDMTSENIFKYGARTGGYPCLVCDTTHDTNSACPTSLAPKVDIRQKCVNFLCLHPDPKVDELTEFVESLRPYFPQKGGSRTYGDLPASIRNMVEPPEWDNKNISEQRDYALDMVDFLEREIGTFRRNAAAAAPGSVAEGGGANGSEKI